MSAHEFLNPYQAKAVEYLLAVTYLILFVPFWRFVSGGAQAPRLAVAPAKAKGRAGWFSLPEGVALHPGHAWLRANGELVAVGLDDLARRLVGPLRGLELPAPGTRLRQGEPAWKLLADGQQFDMLAPLEGTVKEVNERALASPELVGGDPYGEGWLLKVKPTRLRADVKQLLSGQRARQWLELTADSLRRRMSPELGLVLQDGGEPVHGIARELDPERWDQVVREHLLAE